MALDPSQLPPGFTPVPPPLQLIVRTFLAGNLVSILLGGVAIAQFLSCFNLLFSRKDPEWEAKRQSTKWKLLAGALMLLFAAAIADNGLKAVDCMLFIDNVVKQGIRGVLWMPKAGAAVPITESAICFVVQMVYVVRLAVIWPTRGPLVWFGIALTTACAFTQFAAAIWVGTILHSKMLLEWGKATRTGTILWWSVASANDVLLCGAFVFHLIRLRRASPGFKKTNAVLSSWIRLTLETGLLSTVCQLAGLLFLIIWPGDEQPANFALTLVLAQIYLNSILVLFRTMLSGPLKTNVTNSVIPSSLGTSTTGGNSGSGGRGTLSNKSYGSPAGNVHVLKEISSAQETSSYHSPRFPAVRGQEMYAHAHAETSSPDSVRYGWEKSSWEEGRAV